MIMRVSIWQQFSSNHSASFTVVGKCKTIGVADGVTKELRLMIETIRQWHNENRETEEGKAYWEAIAEGGWSGEGTFLSPPERHFAAHYNVDWGRPVDWIHYFTNPEEVVTAVGQLVILQNTSETYVGPPPFDAIVKQLADEVVAGKNEKVPIDANVTCLARSEEVAWEIFNAVDGYLRTGKTTQDQETFPISREEELAYWREIYKRKLQNTPWKHYGTIEYLDNYKGVMLSSTQVKHIKQGMQREHQRLIDDSKRWQGLTRKQAAQHIENDLLEMYYIARGTVLREGQRLTFSGLGVDGDIVPTLAAFLLYLEANGCTSIEYWITVS